VAPEAARRLPRLAVPVDVLAQIVAGTLSPARAAEAGLARSTGGGAEIMNGWFSTRPAYLHPFNAF
jgi:hypothetical protein